eukprot:Gregarina_sp_Poly_1__90@NODE_101_length_14427_cov_132_160237_g88_i0_p9_GENE_NODE_101_length_14427_cov_132_160237_g88_i0NODE_101_length_14427_cov_132_160237_g88_i0_p9_ORF_typecomplete_len164_score40_15Fanconi_A_N/PF15865_5/0_064Phage_min_cap2/PF06152_11/0_14_NODE_101_length_14427_cov_132_160237_g88_i084988989
MELSDEEVENQYNEVVDAVLVQVDKMLLQSLSSMTRSILKQVDGASEEEISKKIAADSLTGVMENNHVVGGDKSADSSEKTAAGSETEALIMELVADIFEEFRSDHSIWEPLRAAAMRPDNSERLAGFLTATAHQALQLAFDEIPSTAEIAWLEEKVVAAEQS